MNSHLCARHATKVDIARFLEHERDVKTRVMAAFTSPTFDEEACKERWIRNLQDPSVKVLALEFDGEVLGHVASFFRDGVPEVTYQIARAHWGRGLATAGLLALLRQHTARPLFARAAADNVGSLRVLSKCGFRETGRERAFAAARGEEIEEVLFRLDAPAADAPG